VHRRQRRRFQQRKLPSVGTRFGLNEVLWKTSSLTSAGRRCRHRPGPEHLRRGKRSPENNVRAVSSNHTPLSQPCGTCGVR
jgi:hypothetical protein